MKEENRMACVKPKIIISYSDEVLTPEEDRELIARALIILFQLDSKMDIKIEEEEEEEEEELYLTKLLILHMYLLYFLYYKL